ncbi:MAG TPA: endonuclease domain-containing protein [Myxococcales bacterium]
MTDFFFREPRVRSGHEMAREFRKAPTLSERILWNELRGRRVAGLKFKRQVPIGPYIVDFHCNERRLVIEVDGDVHDDQQEADAHRQKYLEGIGLRVIRVAAEDVERFLPDVLDRIVRTTRDAPPERS